MKKKIDKCWVCGHEDFTENFPEDGNGVEYCPVCGSYDIEAGEYDPYDEDEGEEGDWGIFQ